MSLSKPYVPCIFDSCGQQFTRKSSLYTHIRNVHKENPEFPAHPSGVHICDYCDKAFTRKDNLCAHIRKVHKKMPDCRLSGQLRCPISGCDDKNMITHSKLRKHLLLSHAFHVEKEELSFSSEDDFLKWKTKLERTETSSYIHSSGWRKLANKGRSIFLSCNRSGMFSSKSKGHRRLKSQGTNKIGATCSSGMHVTVSQDSATQVLFYKTHCGHSLSNAHVSLGCKQRSTIAVRRTPACEQNETTNLSGPVTKTDSSRLSQKLEVCQGLLLKRQTISKDLSKKLHKCLDKFIKDIQTEEKNDKNEKDDDFFVVDETNIEQQRDFTSTEIKHQPKDGLREQLNVIEVRTRNTSHNDNISNVLTSTRRDHTYYTHETVKI